VTALAATGVPREPHVALCSLVVRDARPEDGPGLVALAAACPMAGDLTLCMDRAPDFFALARLEGERWRVGVAEAGGTIVGCVTASERWAYLNGRLVRTAYVGDFKVHPAHRGGPAADALATYAREACRGYGGDQVPALLTVLAGNRSMERRAPGPRGLPELTRFATVVVHSVPLLWRRASRLAGLRVSPARAEDAEEMTALWARLAPARQLAPVLAPESWMRWLDRAPGLCMEDYLVARRADGRIAGFVAVWDQRRFKQLRVLAYSPRMALARRAINLVAPLAGAPGLPGPGAALPSVAALHLCAPAEEPAVLRALLLHAYAERRGGEHAFLNLGLDRRDTLAAALAGLLAQPTLVNAFVTTPAGRWTGGTLDGRPLHFETALV
jgi:hypothetical protein